MTSKDGKYPAKNRETAPRSSLVPSLHSAVRESEDTHKEGCKRKFKWKNQNEIPKVSFVPEIISYSYCKINGLIDHSRKYHNIL